MEEPIMFKCNKTYPKRTLKRVQGRLLDMALQIRDVLNKYKLPYFLGAGTLLGAIRHGGFIPWDDDFDIYIFDEDSDKVDEALIKELPGDMLLECPKTEPRYFHAWSHVKDLLTECDCKMFPQDSCYSHKGVSIDLYRCKLMSRCDWPIFKYIEGMHYLHKRQRQGFMTYGECMIKIRKFQDLFFQMQRTAGESQEEVFASYSAKVFHKKSCVLPLSKVVFHGHEFFAPHNPYEYLKCVYGDFMTLPIVSKRIPHYSFVKFIREWER